MNDDLIYKINCNIQAKIAEKQEEVIMQTIQEIGGDKFCEITFDRNKVIEALTMYQNRDKYAEVKHGEWIYKHRHRGGFERRTAYDEFNNPHTVTLDNRYECDEPYCSVCGKLGGDFLNYCGNCGAKMDAKNDFKE